MLQVSETSQLQAAKQQASQERQGLSRFLLLVYSICIFNMLVSILVSSFEDLNAFEAQIAGKTILTLDAEGVNLCRIGTIELISIGFQDDDKVTKVFLFDVALPSRNFKLEEASVAVLKRILEDGNIVKIIHDCHQDSDALNTHLGIKLTNVFDSLIWNKLISNAAHGTNLNDTLVAHDCAVNGIRDTMKDIYTINPEFWAQRPVTTEMIAYASGDVAVLFDLHQAMLARTADNPELQAAAEQACQTAVDEYRACEFSELVEVPTDRRGKVIGRQGAGIRAIESSSGAFVSKCTPDGFLILATDEKKLAKAKKTLLKFAS